MSVCRLPNCERQPLGTFRTRGNGRVTMCHRHFRRKAAVLPGVSLWWAGYVGLLGIVLTGILAAIAYDCWRTRGDHHE